MKPEHYTISELADAADVTVRTIRFYTAEGLLPAPDARGKYALYSDEHRDRLLLIGRLKEAFWPLSAIREHLSALSASEVSDLLAQTTPPAPMRPTVGEAPPAASQDAVKESAVEYIARVLEATQTTALPAQAGPPVFSPPAEANPPDAAPTPGSPPAPYAPAAVPAPARARRFGLFQRTQSPGVGDDLLLSRMIEPEAHEQAVPSQSWERIEIEPGLELHALQPVSTEKRKFIDKLIAFTRSTRGRS